LLFGGRISPRSSIPLGPPPTAKSCDFRPSLDSPSQFPRQPARFGKKPGAPIFGAGRSEKKRRNFNRHFQTLGDPTIYKKGGMAHREKGEKGKHNPTPAFIAARVVAPPNEFSRPAFPKTAPKTCLDPATPIMIPRRKNRGSHFEFAPTLHPQFPASEEFLRPVKTTTKPVFVEATHPAPPASAKSFPQGSKNVGSHLGGAPAGQFSTPQGGHILEKKKPPRRPEGGQIPSLL